MRRLLFLFCMILESLLTYATSVKYIDGFNYELNDEEYTAKLVRYYGQSYVGGETEELRIPNEVIYNEKNYKVTSVGYAAFESNRKYVQLIIGDNVETIEDNAFRSCEKLRIVKFGKKIKSIGSFAFEFARNLEIYFNCESFPELKKNAFYNTTILTLEYHCKDFRIQGLGTSMLNKIIIGKEVEIIYEEEIDHISSRYLNHIFVEKENTIYDSRDNCNAIINTLQNKIIKGCKNTVIPSSVTELGDYSFSSCRNLNSLTIPNNIKSIGISAFWNCSDMTSVVIPKSINSIGNKAFEYCSNLTSVTIEKESPIDIESNTFSNRANAILYVPKGSVEIYLGANYWNEFSEIKEIQIPCYKLFYVIDGNDYKTYEIEYGASITPEPAPTKEGYTFSGWSEIPETMPDHDVTVIGTFNINKYNLTYTVDGQEYKNYDVEYGATITPEPAPTKEGYTFSGWSDLPETMPAKDVTVTGTFTVNKYKLTYSVDGEEYKSYDIEYGSTITSETEPSKEGYTFSGWSDLPETMPAKDVTVTGTFTVNKYKLTYSVDGEEYKSYDVEYGSTITSETEPTKEGYTFSGWSDIPETMPAKDVIVTGTFTVNKYKLTYSVDGEEYKSYDIEYGSTITSETEPSKEGYTFSGWSDLPETMPAKDVTVTGTFTINKYKVTYMIDGEVYQTVEVEYGSTITPPNPGDREGYDFAWGDYPSTMPAEDITINGSYTATDIRAVLADESDVKIFNVSGKPLNSLQKGVNILRYKDGRTQKLIIK